MSSFLWCLAFAMKLAQRQASLDQCPDVSEEAKKILGEASAPPIRSITFGSGDRAVKIGEETVLFRHDKKFVNPCALAVEIKDTLSEGEITKKIAGMVITSAARLLNHFVVVASCPGIAPTANAKGAAMIENKILIYAAKALMRQTIKRIITTIAAINTANMSTMPIPETASKVPIINTKAYPIVNSPIVALVVQGTRLSIAIKAAYCPNDHAADAARAPIG